MGFFDDLLPNFNNAAEEEAIGGPELLQLPPGAWVALQFCDNASNYCSKLEAPNERRAWHQLSLVFQAIGGDDKVPQKVYSRVSQYLSLDEKDTPGQPSKQIRGLINIAFGGGHPVGSKERSEAAKKVLEEVAAEKGWSPTDTETFPTAAVFVAAVFCEAVLSRTPRLLAKTYLRKGREYVDQNTGERKMSKERLSIGNYEDFTPENLTKRGIVVWGEENPEIAF